MTLIKDNLPSEHEVTGRKQLVLLVFIFSLLFKNCTAFTFAILENVKLESPKWRIRKLIWKISGISNPSGKSNDII